MTTSNQPSKMNLVEPKDKEEEYTSMMNKDQQYLESKKNWFRNQRLDEFLTDEEIMVVSCVLDTFDNLWKNMERTKMKYQDFHSQLKENEKSLSNLNKELDELENTFHKKTEMELIKQAEFQEERHRKLQQQKEALTMDFQMLTEQVKQEAQELKELKELKSMENAFNDIQNVPIVSTTETNENKEMIENVLTNEVLEDIVDENNEMKDTIVENDNNQNNNQDEKKEEVKETKEENNYQQK